MACRERRRRLSEVFAHQVVIRRHALKKIVFEKCRWELSGLFAHQAAIRRHVLKEIVFEKRRRRLSKLFAHQVVMRRHALKQIVFEKRRRRLCEVVDHQVVICRHVLKEIVFPKRRGRLFDYHSGVYCAKRIRHNAPINIKTILTFWIYSCMTTDPAAELSTDPRIHGSDPPGPCDIDVLEDQHGRLCQT
jgi:hypothetical protein